MRIWRFHPKYLDAAGLVGQWYEAICLKKWLVEKRKHKQIADFYQSSYPEQLFNTYLRAIFEESKKRRYNFNPKYIGFEYLFKPVEIDYDEYSDEWFEFCARVLLRDKTWYRKFLENVKEPDPNPAFVVF